jgi:hypothetical protein
MFITKYVTHLLWLIGADNALVETLALLVDDGKLIHCPQPASEGDLFQGISNLRHPLQKLSNQLVISLFFPLSLSVSLSILFAQNRTPSLM